MAQALVGDPAKNKHREVIIRYYDLGQIKDKAQGTLVSILFMTQITELKMLLDIGRQGHRFHDFVLSLLVTSLAMLVLVGTLIMYIGNIRYGGASGSHVGWRQRVKQCLLCRWDITGLCCHDNENTKAEQLRKRKRRSISYLSVPVGVASSAVREGTLSSRTSVENNLDDVSEDSDDVGCCRCHWPSDRRSVDVANARKLDADIEAFKVRAASAGSNVTKAKNRTEELEEMLRRAPNDGSLEEELFRARNDLVITRRDRAQAEADLLLAQSCRQQAYLVLENWESKDERKAFKTVTFWQKMVTYLLYFICLMNIFITAFGLYGMKGGPGRTIILRPTSTSTTTAIP